MIHSKFFFLEYLRHKNVKESLCLHVCWRYMVGCFCSVNRWVYGLSIYETFFIALSFILLCFISSLSSINMFNFFCAPHKGGWGNEKGKHLKCFGGDWDISSCMENFYDFVSYHAQKPTLTAQTFVIIMNFFHCCCCPSPLLFMLMGVLSL